MELVGWFTIFVAALKTDNITTEEKKLSIVEQVSQVIKSMTYLESKIEDVKILMTTLDA